ncbi:MAG TPA: YncE family protein [Saprospiraceae bacterium]|mgnify:CR=1 FL=1|nr:YncE family protein [Saprospiraceae bacterium]
MKNLLINRLFKFFLVVGISILLTSISKGQELALVPNFDDATVSVIDVSSNSVFDVLNVGNGPISVAWHPGGRRVFVSNRTSQSISVFDFNGTAFSLQTTFNVGFACVGISIKPNGGELWIADDTNGAINVFNTSSPYNLITTINFPGDNAWSVEFTPDGTKAIASSPFYTDIAFINTSTYVPNFVTTSLVNGGLGSAISRDGNRYAVTEAGASTLIEIFDVVTEMDITTISVGNQPSSAVWSLDNSRLYVTNFGDNSISVINTNTNTVTNTIPASGLQPNGIDLSSNGNHLYVPLSGSNVVEVFSTLTETSVSTIPVGLNPVNVGRFIFRIHPIPTLSQWGILVVFLILCITGVLSLNHKKKISIKSA